MEISQSVLDRIFKAADELHTEAGRVGLPTVDSVRKRARVNMNDASSGMKVWRLAQTSTCSPMPAQLPPELQASCMSSLSGLWTEATNLANESLRAAQLGWEAERANAETLAKEMAAAFDIQTSELEAAALEIARLNSLLKAASTDVARVKSEQELAERGRVAATAAATEAAARALEIERRADELQKAVEHARNEASAVRADMIAIRTAHTDQLERVRQEARNDIENERTSLARDRERYRESETNALAEAARLQGRLEALDELLSRPKPGAKRTKKTPDRTVKGNGAPTSERSKKDGAEMADGAS
jgi:colicin import membrane protein